MLISSQNNIRGSARAFLFFILIFSLAVFSFVSAQSPQNETEKDIAGFIPSSRFYFIDRIFEKFQELFVFNPLAKARLQVKFAKERLAEVKVELEQNGVSSPGVAQAQDELLKNVDRAKNFVTEAKNEKGESTSTVKDLGDEVESEIESLREGLKETFEDHEKDLKKMNEDLKDRSKGGIGEDDLNSAGFEERLKELEQQESVLKDLMNEAEDFFKEDDKGGINRESDADMTDIIEGSENATSGDDLESEISGESKRYERDLKNFEDDLGRDIEILR